MHWTTTDRVAGRTAPRALVLLLATSAAASILALGTAFAEEPAVAAIEPPDVEGLQLEDTPEPFVPLRPRSSREEDHIHALALFAAGRVAEQKQDYPLALRNYQRAYRFDSDALAALREIVPLAFNLDRQEEGVRYALILAERDPADAGLLRRLAVYLTEGGDTQRALNLYEKAEALHQQSGEKPSSGSVLTWLEMGRLYFVAKKFDQAAEYFARVAEALEKPEEFELTPEVKQALLSRGELSYQLFGEAFLNAGRQADALAAFERVQEIKADEGRHLYNLARVDAANKQPAQALAKLEKYLDGRFTVQGTAPYELYAELRAELGQQDQITARLADYRAADSKNVPLSYFLAERYRQAGDVDQAEPIYAALVEQRPNRPPLEAVVALVDIYRQQQAAEKLLALLGDSIGRAGSLAPLGEAGQTLLSDTDAVRAVVAAAQKQLEADPQAIDYGQCVAAAMLATRIQDYDAAEALYEAALAADDAKPAELLVGWGLSLFVDNQYDSAAKVFQRAIDDKVLPEGNAALHFYLAGALEMSGRTDEALEQARQAAELQKDSPRFASRVAWIQFHARRLDEARQGYLDLLKRFDKQHDSPEVREVMRDARLVLSNIAVMQDDLADAEEWLEQVLDEFPEDHGALNDLGYLWADAGKHLERAHDMIQVAVAHDPTNRAYRDSLGWVLFRLGKYPEAVAELKVAAAASDADGVILDHLAEAQLKNGETAAAVETWRRALEAFEHENEPDQAEEVRRKLKQAEAQAAETPGEPKAEPNGEPAPDAVSVDESK